MRDAGASIEGRHTVPRSSSPGVTFDSDRIDCQPENPCRTYSQEPDWR